MIISEFGTVVGRLDPDTLELENVTSPRLQELVDDWRANGIVKAGPAKLPESGPMPACAMTFYTTPFDTDSLGLIGNELLIAGFEVQRD